MIVLDTNVISELTRPKPHPGALAWVTAQPRAQLCTTTDINQAEILFCIAALPTGRGFDGLIAATALAAGAHVATRDVRGFSGCGLTLIDPWSAS